MGRCKNSFWPGREDTEAHLGPGKEWHWVRTARTWRPVLVGLEKHQRSPRSGGPYAPSTCNSWRNWLPMLTWEFLGRAKLWILPFPCSLSLERRRFGNSWISWWGLCRHWTHWEATGWRVDLKYFTVGPPEALKLFGVTRSEPHWIHWCLRRWIWTGNAFLVSMVWNKFPFIPRQPRQEGKEVFDTSESLCWGDWILSWLSLSPK